MYRDYLNQGVFTEGDHTLKEQLEQEERKLQQKDRVIETQSTYVRLFRMSEGQLEKIFESKNAYFTDAWKRDTKAFRDQQALPSHNINIFAPEVDGVVGLERMNRRGLMLHPVERDDEQRAELLGIYLRHLEKVNKDFYCELDLYRTGLITARAHQELYWDFSDDPFGELKSVNRPPEEILLDANMNDTDTLNGDITERVHMEWVDPREVTKRYGTKVDVSLLEDVDPDDRPRTTSKISVQGVSDSYDYPSDRYRTFFWNKERRTIRLIRCWRRDNKEIFRLMDLNENLPVPELAHVDDFDTKDELEKYRMRLALIGRDVSEMIILKARVYYWSYHVISGRAELEWIPDVGRYAPWIDFFAITVDGRYAGLWNRVEDRQRWVNYTMSKLSERMGRLGHVPIFVRENSFVQNTNLSAAMRDGNPIVVREDAWRELQGSPPFYSAPDRSLESISPLITLAQDMRQDAINSVGQGSVQRGANPPGVTAASALAILQQEGTKITSGYAQNLQLARANKAQLRLWMLLEQYKRTPELIKLKLERIFGSVLRDNSQPEMQKLIMSKMVQGGVNLDDLILSIRNIKYDVTLSDDPSSLMEKLQLLQWLQVLPQYGVEVSGESIIDAVPIPGRIKDTLRQGMQQKKEQIQQMLASPEGQMMLDREAGNKGKAKDGNNLLPSTGPFSENSMAQAAV